MGVAKSLFTVDKGRMLPTAALLIAVVFGQSTSGSAPDDRCVQALQAAANESRATSLSLTADAQYAETHGGSFSPSMTRDFVSWYDKARSQRRADFPALTATVLTSKERAKREAAVHEYLRFRTARREREATDRLERTIAACPHRADELRGIVSEARRAD